MNTRSSTGTEAAHEPGTVIDIGGVGHGGYGVAPIEIRESTGGLGWAWRVISDDEKQQLIGALNSRTPANEEISKCWQTLEEHGFPPEACGWPFRSIVGELPNAIDCAIDCLVRQRENLLAEVQKLRPLAPAQGARDCGKVSAALRNAALFLELGAKYAPDERISQKIEVTGEMLKTRGLATVMRTVAASCAELVDSPEQDPASAGLQSQSGINQSLPEGTPGEGVSLPSTERLPMTSLDELATRVEKLAGPCRETDALIAETIMPSDDHRFAIINDIGLQAYTGSIDAAMLVAVKSFSVKIETGTQQHAEDFRWPVMKVWRNSDGLKICTVQAVTLPLTICAGWLRARAASEDRSNG